MAKEAARKILATNRKAFYRFEILETIEAGIELTGSEVKSAKGGGLAMGDSYAVIKAGECWLLNCHISPYSHDTSRMQTDPTRSRRLLLHKKEIYRLTARIQAKGLTAVPLEVYVNEHSRVKIQLGLARGKKGPDKREDIRKKDLQREMGHKFKIR